MTINHPTEPHMNICRSLMPDDAFFSTLLSQLTDLHLYLLQLQP